MSNLIKTEKQLQKMRVAGDVVAQILAKLYKMIIPGNNGLILAATAFAIMKKNNCESNFLNYCGFSDVICVSINNELIHGIPNDRVFREGDLVSVDVGCKYQGMHADAALTKIVGTGNKINQELVFITKKSLNLVIQQISAGQHVGNVGHIISSFIKKKTNYFLNNEFSGHGIGTKLHEDPSVLNIDFSNSGIVLKPNMVICVEPMVLMGDDQIKTLSDGWTVVSKNGQNNCHFEHMLLIKKDGCEILTNYEKYLD